jgi:hypothetical protein
MNTKKAVWSLIILIVMGVNVLSALAVVFIILKK